VTPRRITLWTFYRRDEAALAALTAVLAQEV
jgi:hypothetical protein